MYKHPFLIVCLVLVIAVMYLTTIVLLVVYVPAVGWGIVAFGAITALVLMWVHRPQEEDEIAPPHRRS